VQYDWPGNVRELRNAVEAMIVRSKGNILTHKKATP
jgi:DNA-binding NtrC family response regulator